MRSPRPLAGDIINFAPGVTTIDLSSSLVISKNVTIEGSQPSNIGTPGVTIDGGGGASNFSDFVINAGVSATFDGLIIADGHATGATGTTSNSTYGIGGTGGAAAGGIFDNGDLTLTNSVLQGDTATGGAGGGTYLYGAGGGGGSALAPSMLRAPAVSRFRPAIPFTTIRQSAATAGPAAAAIPRRLWTYLSPAVAAARAAARMSATAPAHPARRGRRTWRRRRRAWPSRIAGT